jgi:hypothetical protein
MILAPTLLLNAGSGAAIARPTFSRDFAGEKTLDNGTGPAITFTRGSNATYFDASGTLRFAPNNHIRNSEAGGSTNGVIGSGGVGPTHWGPQITAGAGSVEIIGTGTSDGFNYIDIKWSGTNSTGSSAFILLNFEGGNQVAASSGQTWTQSAYISLVGGSTSGLTVLALAVVERDATTNGQIYNTSLLSATSTRTRYSATGTLGNTIVTTTHVLPRISGTVPNGATIDLTLRIAAPQLEIGSTATDYNPTTGTAYFGPRFDHSGGSSLGLLIEEARTNSIRNSQAGGAVTGSPGTMPTNWLHSSPFHGLNREIVATGTLNGLSYIDIRISGTANTTGGLGIFFEGATTAAAGQTWTGSAYIALVAGSIPSSVRVGVEEAVGTTRVLATFVTTSPTATLTRFSATRTFTDATTNSARAFVDYNYANGAAVDLTLRIAAPQLEQGAFATSYIPTTTAAATRAADSAVVTPISSFYNQSEGTLFAEFSRPQTTNVANFLYFGGASPNFLAIENNATAPSTLNRFLVESSAGAQANIAFTPISANTIYKFTGAYAPNSFQAAQNGTLGTEDTAGSLPSVSQMSIGAGQFVSGSLFKILNGHIRKIAYWPRRLSNSLLQQLTT